MGKREEVRDTPAQQALAQVSRQMLTRWEQKWQPIIQNAAKGIVEAGAAASFERRRADTMAKVDTSAAFAGAREKLDATAATGGLGSAAHKLGIAGMNNDQATSSGLSAVAADQVGDNALVTGLGAVTAMGRGEQATALNGLSQVAQLSGQQAAADAEASLADKVGTAQIVGSAVGLGAGLALRKPAEEKTLFSDYSNLLPDELPNETARFQRQTITGSQ